MTATKNLTNELHEDIQKQLNIGFKKNSIANNLLLKGHSKEDIKDAFTTIKAEQTTNSHDTGSASATSIWLGIIFIVVVIIKLTTSANNSSFLLALAAIICVGSAVYYFTKKEGKD